VYRELQTFGILQSNYIIKLVNGVRRTWSGTMELANVDTFVVSSQSYVLMQYMCSTRQNLFNMGAYVIDRDAALILLDRFVLMRFHVDIYLHYIGYRFSNLDFF